MLSTTVPSVVVSRIVSSPVMLTVPDLSVHGDVAAPASYWLLQSTKTVCAASEP
jgi:hypothetical protein